MMRAARDSRLVRLALYWPSRRVVDMRVARAKNFISLDCYLFLAESYNGKTGEKSRGIAKNRLRSRKIAENCQRSHLYTRL